MKTKMAFISLCAIAVWVLFLWPSYAISNCYIIDGLGTTISTVQQGSKVGVYATVNNCFSGSKRMYVQTVATSACGESANVFTSEAKTYRSRESKYFYTSWKVPYGYSANPFGGITMCKGRATITMTVYEKNFWGTSKYISSAYTNLTIK